MNTRERLLKIPFMYRTLTLMVSPASLAADTVRDFLAIPDGSRVLDLGCGYGEIAKFFVGRTNYVGIDSNAGYIDEARRRFDGTNARFIVADIGDPEVLALGNSPRPQRHLWVPWGDLLLWNQFFHQINA